MPPTKTSFQLFQVVSEEGLEAYRESEAEAKANRLMEIEQELMVENDIYFKLDLIMNDKNLSKIGAMIMSYLNFESLIEARMVSKTWYRFLEKERGLWISSLRHKLEFLKEGSWCDYNKTCIDKKYPRIQVLFKANEKYNSWEQLSLVIKSNGSVADFISFIQRMEDSYDRKNSYCGNWEMKIVKATFEFEHSPLEAAIFYGKYFWRDLKFLKILKKHNFIHGIENLAKEFVYWAVSEMKDTEALEFVLSIITEIPLYSVYDLQYGSLVYDPILYAIRKQEIKKLKLLVPLATIQYWNSKSSYPFGFRDGHSPLIDSIMIGNLDIVQLLIPLTDLISGSHIHAAVRYGRFEIFKHLCGLFNDWKKVKNKRGSTIYQVLVDKNYLIEVNDMEPGPICRSPKFAEKGLSEEFQHKMLNFINEN